jgi:hypothetical protein
VDNDLGVSVNPLIELVVCRLCVFDSDLVRDNKARLRFAGDDQVAQLAVVGFYIALAGSEGEALYTKGWLDILFLVSVV